MRMRCEGWTTRQVEFYRFLYESCRLASALQCSIVWGKFSSRLLNSLALRKSAEMSKLQHNATHLYAAHGMKVFLNHHASRMILFSICTHLCLPQIPQNRLLSMQPGMVENAQTSRSLCTTNKGPTTRAHMIDSSVGRPLGCHTCWVVRKITTKDLSL